MCVKHSISSAETVKALIEMANYAVLLSRPQLYESFLKIENA